MTPPEPEWKKEFRRLWTDIFGYSLKNRQVFESFISSLLATQRQSVLKEAIKVIQETRIPFNENRLIRAIRALNNAEEKS